MTKKPLNDIIDNNPGPIEWLNKFLSDNFYDDDGSHNEVITKATLEPKAKSIPAKKETIIKPKPIKKTIFKKNKPKKISVIIPVKDGELNIVNCIKSATNNAYNINDVEIIVIDGGSTDTTATKLLSFDKHIRCYTSKHIGKGHQMNFGAIMASSPHLLFIHVDTVLCEDYDRKIIKFFENEKMNVGMFKARLDGSERFLAISNFYTNNISKAPHGSYGMFIRKLFFDKNKFNTETNLTAYDYVKYKCKSDEWEILDSYVTIGSDNYKGLSGKNEIGTAFSYFFKNTYNKTYHSMIG